jgi:magnesium-transporting ATPase (P-type)
MVVIIATPDDDEFYTMVVKGAPEEILKAEYEFVGDDAETLLETIFTEQCDSGLKCISYASGKIEKA